MMVLRLQPVLQKFPYYFEAPHLDVDSIQQRSQLQDTATGPGQDRKQTSISGRKLLPVLQAGAVMKVAVILPRLIILVQTGGRPLSNKVITEIALLTRTSGVS